LARDYPDLKRNMREGKLRLNNLNKRSFFSRNSSL